MSRNEWENGELALPSDAVAPLRKAVRDACNALAERVLAECVRLWNGPLGQPKTAEELDQKIDAVLWSGNGRIDQPVAAAVQDVFQTMTYAGYNVPRTKPHLPHATDVEKVIPTATNRTDRFQLGEWAIVFKDNQVAYGVSENNHARESAEEHPVVRAFFAALGRVTWTRDSGGAFWGNDENNQDSRGSGGGNYITRSFGPRGEMEQASQMGVTIERYRAMMGSRPRR